MTSKEIQEMITDLEDQIERFGVMNTFNLQLSILKSYKQDLERLELEVHCKNNSIKILEALHKSQIEKYLQKQNKLLDELIICKQQIKILKKALPYYNIKVLCNAGRITEEELEILLKYEVINDDK